MLQVGFVPDRAAVVDGVQVRRRQIGFSEPRRF
jgi:hypothetical protein